MKRFLFFAVVTLFLSCSKQGPAGPQGQQGAVGPAGQAGSQVYSGSGAPSGSTGAAGDYYLDVSTGNLYGPKTGSGWGTPLDLKGAAGASGTTGATGAAGSQIYAGTTVPASSLGAVGDYYLDKTTYMLYGPKTANGWGTPVLLQGPQGPMGNANVMVDTFTLTSAQYAWNSSYSFATVQGGSTTFFTRYHDCAFPAVTPAVLATGMVLVYFIPDPNYPNQWAPLPYSFLDFFSAYYYNFVYKTNVGVVTIHYFYTVNGTTGAAPTTLSTAVIATHRFKLVAVSGQIADAMRRSNVDVNDEAAVSRFLGAAPGVFGVDRRVLPVALIR